MLINFWSKVMPSLKPRPLFKKIDAEATAKLAEHQKAVKGKRNAFKIIEEKVTKIMQQIRGLRRDVETLQATMPLPSVPVPVAGQIPQQAPGIGGGAPSTGGRGR
jgi:hypothetical protein